MNEQELQEFLKMVTPMLKALPEEEIRKQLNEIEDMSEEEREQFLKVILLLKEEEG